MHRIGNEKQLSGGKLCPFVRRLLTGAMADQPVAD